MHVRTLAISGVLLGSISALFAFGCAGTAGPSVADNSTPQRAATPPMSSAEAVAPNHLDQVMTSRFCAGCHPDIYAEHEQNTHGRAFTDEEVRLATGRFDHGDCIRCHTPRPIFETGIGMNPMRRYHGLEEGNTCMTCHWKPEHDYSRFEGGIECKTAFDERVGKVEACAACHRNHGTPYQWELAPTGKAAGKDCIECHMSKVTRPVAVGEPPRPVRSHVFPGARNDRHVRRAYAYEAHLEGNEVVVKVSNKGAGHNFPTELKQRSVESLVVVRDVEGREVARSRMVFRDPYKRPYGLNLPVNTQIPAGESREHRVPISVAAGSADCELHFKLYYPIEDHHPDLARRLEARRLLFDGITPSAKPVESAPDVRVRVPESIDLRQASPADLVDFARPPIDKVEVELPQGDGPEDVRKLIELFQFPVPAANGQARARLTAIGAKAVPALVEALGSWDNKTYNQAMAVLKAIGEPAKAAVLAALSSDQLYVRLHARQVLADKGWRVEEALAAMRQALSAPNALDRRSSAEALGALGDAEAAPLLRARLSDTDPDVVVSAATALASLQDDGALPALLAALARATFFETKRDLAVALARLGSPRGVPVLLTGLDHPDDLLRESSFESLLAVTGLHKGYEPFAPRPERLDAIARLQVTWARDGGKALLRQPQRPRHDRHARAWTLVDMLGGGSGSAPAGDDAKITEELLGMKSDAVPALLLGLKFPAGFADKRAKVCELLGRIGDPAAAPALAATLRDPVVAVAAWACWALGALRDPEVLPALRRYQDRLLTLASSGQMPADAGSVDVLLAQAASSRLMLGDESARRDLVDLLLADDVTARRGAIDTLERKYGERRGYDAEADAAARRAAVARWLE